MYRPFLIMATAYNLLTEADINAILREVVDKFLIPRFDDLGMNASGKWKDSLQTEYDKATSVGKIRGMDYTKFLTIGRNPNADQSEEGLRAFAVWAGNTFIGDWVRDKGISADPIAVAYSIGKNGTTWKQKGGSNLLEVFQEKQTIDFITSRVRAVVTPRVAEQLRRNARSIRIN